MIETMKMVHVVTTVSRKRELLKGLKDLGLLHIAEKKQASAAAARRFQDLSKLSSELQEYAPKKEKAGKAGKTGDAPEAAGSGAGKALEAAGNGAGNAPALKEEELLDLLDKAAKAIEDKRTLTEDMQASTAEAERLAPWGDFDPDQVRALRKDGFDLHFYRVDGPVWEAIEKDEKITAVRLASVEKAVTIAVIGRLPQGMAANEFELPAKGLSGLQAEVEEDKKKIADCESLLRKAACYEDAIRKEMIKAQNAEDDSAADRTAVSDEKLVWISGYIPEADLDPFRAKAREESWAYAIDDVSKDDEAIPTKLRYNKVTRLISPIYKILGILPGYRETDISLWFLLFFALFFAMIIGDGGYGALILLFTIGLAAKKKKMTTPIYLLLVLSITTIVWGAITGTWFGMESAMKVPFLKALVLPGFANYPEYFGLTAAAQQNNIMKFSFTIGAIQMEIGSLIAVKKKIGQKDLSFVSDIGWMITIVSMYLLSLYLVLGEKLTLGPIGIGILIGFILVVLFSGMSPDASFAEGLKAGLGGAFTSFLNTISCFGNVMSYIRLFAVGMAGLAIAQSFNNMAAGLAHGPLIIVAAVVVVLGHAINIVMCFLSVIVHGIRLNVLEFSGQVGLEWTGIAYDPFREQDQLRN
jgi:V/A-type H+-transporting ATPase subunit I